MNDLKSHADTAAQFLKNMANPNRLLILCLLAQGEKNVTALLDHLDISQTALSQHLARLRDEDIVDFRRDHRTLYYYIKNPHVMRIVGILADIYCP